ncbi:hypothetical protein LVB87_00050 [Lysobacter sp. KIS68-7]|uniref:hypothetical protein n=1 Tax=Lysobacter sp. KIS68-7 TaxID=2904252 RepID=UPI001E50676D|nr:hypothetical protein [Lysobacter sp. KIS68-7]UHQ19606.1 hypothetical protein LVB87_00050 [Lysobacter sp. KIS68-7]
MRLWKRAGMWLAVGVAVVVMSWTVREIEAKTTHASPAPAPTHRRGPTAQAAVAPLLTIPAGATLDAPQTFQFDADMARRAIRAGSLRIALPDGTTYPVRMEHQVTDAAGRWSVIGRVATPLGSEAMVLTFGPDAIFGVLPTPSGRAMQIETGPGGRTTIAPTRDLSPRYSTVRPGTWDSHAPPYATTPDELLRAESDFSANAAPVDRLHDGTLQIRVLAMYSGDLARLRGSVSAAETEVANLFAIANQASIDSGSAVRWVMVGLQRIDLPASLTNQQALRAFGNAKRGRVSVFDAMRDVYAADFAAYIRPARAGDHTCGATSAKGDVVVANPAPCSEDTLARHLAQAIVAR